MLGAIEIRQHPSPTTQRPTPHEGTFVGRTISADDLDDIALGAAVLGTGGGGDPYIGKLMAARALRDHGPVQLIHPDELDDDALVIPVGMMGAPTVMVEKL